jgi:hypothetical protein
MVITAIVNFLLFGFFSSAARLFPSPPDSPEPRDTWRRVRFYERKKLPYIPANNNRAASGALFAKKARRF